MDLINSQHEELWRYPRFFSDNAPILNGDDLRHAKTVLRMKSGDKAIICDCNRTDYLCEFNGEDFIVLSSIPNTAELDIRLRLYQCLPKSDKFDFIIQKAVELGVTEIIPVKSARCVSRPDNKSAVNKISRWNKIAYAAAKQSGRGIIPAVGSIITFKEAIQRLKPHNLSILFYECGGRRLNEIIKLQPNCTDIDIIIGSEGGFEPDEAVLAENAGAVVATLGKRILRVETASVAALSIIMNLIEQ